MANEIVLRPQEGKQRLAFDMHVDVMIYGGGAGCLPGYTEILTDHGWKRIDNCSKDTVIAEYSHNDQEIYFRHPEAYIKLPCETFYRLDGDNLSLTLSAEHKVLYKDKNSYTQVDTWADILNDHEDSKYGWEGSIPTALNTVNAEGLPFSIEQLKLYCALIFLGKQISYKGNTAYYQNTDFQKLEQLKFLAEKANLNTRRHGDYVFIELDQVINHFYTYFYKANMYEIEEVISSLRMWKHINNGEILFVNKQDADFIQYCYSVLNYNTRLKCSFHDPYELFTLTVDNSQGGYTSLASDLWKAPVMDVYSNDGFKYCFTTSTGYFVARQNNQIFITGNSGKSYLCLLKALKYAYQDPDFNGVIFRRNSDPVRQGLFAKAKSIYRPLKPHVKEQAMEMDFRKTHGGHLKFTHLDQVSSAEMNHQGQEYTMVLFDELTQFEQEQFLYLIGRLRSESKTSAFCMATCNPDPDSFVLDWVEWYLDPEGFPDQDKVGKIRYFITKDDKPVFRDTPEELEEEFPEYCWVENPNTGEKTHVPPMSFTFISASVFDNPALLNGEPRYMAKLKGQTEVMRRRLLEGNWYARAQGSNFFSREWLKKADNLPDDVRIVRAWDKGYSEPSEKNRHPDYTSSIKMAKDDLGNYYLIGDYCDNHHDKGESVLGSFRVSIGQRNKWMLEQAKADETLHNERVQVVIPKESGAGKGETEQLIRMFESEMIAVTVADVTNVKFAKEKRFSAFSSAAENGLVYIIESSFNRATLEFFYNQLEKFDGQRSTAYKKDDLVDAVSDAYNTLQQEEITRPVRLPRRKINTLYNSFKHGFNTQNRF